VPQEGQTPLVAGLPFFMVTALALFISFLERHFTQYASIFRPRVFRFLNNLSKTLFNIARDTGRNNGRETICQQIYSIFYFHSSSLLTNVNRGM